MTATIDSLSKINPLTARACQMGFQSGYEGRDLRFCPFTNPDEVTDWNAWYAVGNAYRQIKQTVYKSIKPEPK